MFLINLRQDGIKGNTFSRFEQISYLDEDMNLYSMTDDDLMQQVAQKNILVLIHGFNNTTHHIQSVFKKIEQQYRIFFNSEYDAIIGYVWPGGESEFNYFKSKRNARRAGRKLRHWIYRFSKAQCTIDVIGHSMATIVGYHALQTNKKMKIRNVFSFGAAVSQNIFVEESTEQIIQKMDSLYLFHTENDDILKYWFRLVEWQDAVGYSGLKNQNEVISHLEKLTIVDCSEVISNHTEYWNSRVIFEFIGKTLSGKQYPRKYKLLPGFHRVFDKVLGDSKKRLSTG